MIVEWRTVVNSPSYEVSNEGAVRRSRPGKGTWVGRALRPQLRGGYPTVFLSEDGKVTQVRVHTLVTEAFIGPRPPGLIVDHKNGSPLDNRVENLRYVTFSENALNAIRHGVRLGPPPKYSSEIVAEIRRLFASGVQQKEIAERFGISKGHVSAIVLNKLRTTQEVTHVRR